MQIVCGPPPNGFLKRVDQTRESIGIELTKRYEKQVNDMKNVNSARDDVRGDLNRLIPKENLKG